MKLIFNIESLICKLLGVIVRNSKISLQTQFSFVILKHFVIIKKKKKNWNKTDAPEAKMSLASHSSQNKQYDGNFAFQKEVVIT